MNKVYSLETLDLEKLYDELEKRIKQKTPKILNQVGKLDSLPFQGTYPSKIIERAFFVECLEKLELIDKNQNPIYDSKVSKDMTHLRKFTINNGELLDTLYPVIKTGLTYEGVRKSKRDKIKVPTYLVETSFMKEIPKAIYFILNRRFKEEEFLALYTELELKMLENLLEDLMKGVLSDKGKAHLKVLMTKDNTLKEFAMTMKSFLDTIVVNEDSIKIPKILGKDQYTPRDEILVKDEFTLIEAYVRSVMLNVFASYINNVIPPNQGLYIRSIDTLKLVIEVDKSYGELDISISTKNGFLFSPKVERLKG